jgi:hypothetical protein
MARLRVSERAAIFVLLAVVAAPASAQTDGDAQAVQAALRALGPEVAAFAKQAALATVSRARRMVAVGPLVGAAPSYLITDHADQLHVDGTASFGLGLYLWKVPLLPSTDWIVDALKARVMERIKQTILHGQPPPGANDVEQLVREVWEELKAQVLEGARGSIAERPLGKLVFEAGYLVRGGAWEARTTAGVGVKWITVGITFAGAFREHKAASLGPELAFHLTLGKGPRSHVVDMFVRADIFVNNRQYFGEQVGLGARFLLDLL